MGLLNSIKRFFGIKPKPKAGSGSRKISKPKPPMTEAEKTAAYISAIEAQREEKVSFFRLSPYSPIEPEARRDFDALKYYDVDPAFKFVLPLNAVTEKESIVIQTNTGDEQDFYRLGTVDFEIAGEKASLAVYQGVENPQLFIPFKDTSNGTETYGAGRYLEPMALANGDIELDFNLAFNPYCAYSENYVCPLPPSENWLTVSIRAGEKAYK